jgi:hypothetical protein
MRWGDRDVLQKSSYGMAGGTSGPGVLQFINSNNFLHKWDVIRPPNPQIGLVDA